MWSVWSWSFPLEMNKANDRQGRYAIQDHGISFLDHYHRTAVVVFEPVRQRLPGRQGQRVGKVFQGH